MVAMPGDACPLGIYRVHQNMFPLIRSRVDGKAVCYRFPVIATTIIILCEPAGKRLVL